MVPAAVRMLGMCAAGTFASGNATSRRRVHSPAAISAMASRPPRKMRTPGPISPASIEYCTMKMPPSASAMPPIHTTQLAPKRSSKLFAGGAGSAGGRGRCAAAMCAESLRVCVDRGFVHAFGRCSGCGRRALNDRRRDKWRLGQWLGLPARACGALRSAMRNSSAVTRLRSFSAINIATIATTAARNSINRPS